MSDPLLRLLRKVRENHRISQDKIARCLSVTKDTYRHMEKGRRPLPDFRDGLTTWIKRFEDCVGASEQERIQIFRLLERYIVQEFSILVDDLRPPSPQPQPHDARA